MTSRAPHSGMIVLCTVAIAAVSYLWALRLPFQVDDFHYLANPGQWLRQMEDKALGRGSEILPSGLQAKLFRPVLWTWFQGLSAVAGRPISPAVFHAASVGLHMACAGLLVVLLATFLPRTPTLLGALVFAVHPAAAQAVTWVSAAGDLLSTLLALLSCIVAVRCRFPGRASSLAVGSLAGLSVLSKETAVLMAPLPILLLARRRGASGGWLPTALLASLPIAIAWAVRFVYLGTLSPSYLSGNPVWWEPLLNAIRTPALVLDALGYLLVPWNPQADPPPLASAIGISGWPPTRALYAAVSICALVAAAVLGRRSRLKALGALTLVTLVLTLPLMQLWSYGSGAALSRTLYPHQVLFASAWALAFDALLSWRAFHRPLVRAAVRAIPLLVLAMSADALIHGSRVFTRVGDAIDSRLESLAAVADRAPPGTALLALDSEFTRFGQYLLGHNVSDAMRPPFRAHQTPLYHAFDPRVALYTGLLASINEPLMVVGVTNDCYVPLTGPLPGIPADGLPRLEVKAAESGEIMVRPPVGTPPRAVPGVRVALPAGGTCTVAMEFLVDGRRISQRFAAREGTEARRSNIYLDMNPDYLTGGRLQGISVKVEGGGWAEAALADIEVLPFGNTDMRILSPSEGLAMDVDSFDELAIQGTPPEATLRVDVLLYGLGVAAAAEARWATWSSDSDGTARVRLSEAAVNGSGALLHGWDDVKQAVRTAIRQWSNPEVVLVWRAEAECPDGGTTVGRSKWHRLTLRD